jgi:hypothetical protein
MDPIIALMAILGIGGGFAGLWWGWLAGEVEADMRRVACEFRSLSEMIDRGTVGFQKFAEGMLALSISSAEFGDTMDRAANLYFWGMSGPPKRPATPEFEQMLARSPWAGGRTRIGERSHRRLLAVGIDDGWRPSLDPDGGSEERHPSQLPVDLPADAEKIDAPSDVPGPGAAPPETK